MTFPLEDMAKNKIIYDSWISSFNKVSFECFKTAKPLKNLALNQVQTVRFCELRQILGLSNFCSANMRSLHVVYAPSDDLFPSQWLSASKVLVVNDILLHCMYTACCQQHHGIKMVHKMCIVQSDPTQCTTTFTQDLTGIMYNNCRELEKIVQYVPG